MSNYTKTTNFATKDNLSPGNPLKIVKGTEIDTEFNNIATAVGTKTDNASAAITGGSITGITDLAVADGGTGASTAANARSNLSAAASGANSDITSLTGLTTPLTIAQGGTTASTAAGARTSLGLVIGTDVLAPNGSAASLTSFPTLNQNTTGNAATVTTNANLTGDVTSVGNATTLTNAPVIAKVLTGYVSGAGTVAATDSILQAIQKLNGNDATNANLTGAVTSVGNATSLGSFSSANLLSALTDETGTGVAVFATSPVLTTPNLGTPTTLVLTAATGLPLTTGVTGQLPVANGGTGTATPSIVAGTNVTVTGTWPNQTIAASGGGSGTVTSVAASVPSLFSISGSPITTSGTLAMTYSGTALPVVNGGTGLTTTPANGALDIGNGTGFTRATLTAGTNITITNSSGGISIAAAGSSSQWTTTGSDIYYNTGNVGIGTSSPVGKMQFAQTNNTTINGGAYINLGKSENGVGGYHLIGMGYNTGSDYAPTYMGYVETNNASGTAGDLVFLTRPTSNASTTAPTERMRIPAAGGVQAVSTISVGNATPSTSGAGITFPATQSASSDANTLDDYEEGTYTPTDASGAGLSFSSAGGFYTKIGRQVICFFYIAFPSTASTAVVAIGSLPFTTGNNVVGGVFTGAIAYNTYGSFQLVGPSSVTYFNMSTPTGTDITNVNMSGKTVRGSFLYFV